MRMKDLIKHIYERFQEVSNKPERITKDPDDLIHLENQRRCMEIETLLASYADSTLEATEENVKPLCDYLVTLWSGIKDTDAILCHHYETRANRYILSIAHELSPIVSIHPYQLLIPTLKIHEKCYDAPLNNAVMSDDNTALISVSECLNTARDKVLDKKFSKLEHTHSIHGAAELSEDEKNRVAGHSEQALRYFKNIVLAKTSRLKKQTITKLSHNQN